MLRSREFCVHNDNNDNDNNDRTDHFTPAHAHGIINGTAHHCLAILVVGSHYLRGKAVPDDHYVQPGAV